MTDNLLIKLISQNPEIRSQAEKTYSNIATDTKALYLVGAIQNAEVSEDGRQTAADLLLRLFSEHFYDFFPKLPFEQQKLLREQLLLTIQMDITQTLRRKVCDVVSEVANHLDDGANQWPEFIQFMFTCVHMYTQDSNMKEALIRIVTSVHLDAIKSMLLAALQPTESQALRVQAVEAVGAFVLHLEPALQKHLSDVLEPMMRAVVESMEIANDSSALKVVLEMADTSPTFLRPQLENIFQAAIKMVGDKHRHHSLRDCALDVMVTLCFNAPAMVKKRVPQAVHALTRLVLEMMCEIEDDPEWAMEDDDPYPETVAEGNLALMRNALSGMTMLRLLVGWVPVMLQSWDWRRRHAALMAVSFASGYYNSKIMKNSLDEVGSAVLNHLADPHPRVRYAACNAVMLMSTDFAPIFEEKFNDKVVFGLFLLLDDNANLRVQAHAAAALAKFSKHCPKPILTIYLEPLMDKLEVILTAKSRGLAVGEEKILADASEVMELLLKTYTEDERLPANCRQTLFFFDAWSRICRIMGKNFAHYLPRVMGPVMEALDWHFNHRIDNSFNLHDEQYNFAKFCASLNLSSACDMIVCCARELKGAFAEYAEDCVKLMVPLLKCCDSDVRKAAAESLPCLLECARVRGQQYIEGMWAYILPELLKAIDSEQHQTVQAKLLNSLEKSIELLGTGCLTDETMDEVLRILNKLLTEHIERAAEHQRQRAHEDYDECIDTGYLTDETMVEVLRILNKLLTEHIERAAEHQRQRAHEDYDEVNIQPVEGHASAALKVHRVVVINVLAALAQHAASGTFIYQQMVTFVTLIRSNPELYNFYLMQLSTEQKEALQQALSRVA